MTTSKELVRKIRSHMWTSDYKDGCLELDALATKANDLFMENVRLKNELVDSITREGELLPLRARIAELEKDKARLEWAIKHPGTFGSLLTLPKVEPRVAIDNYMKGEK